MLPDGELSPSADDPPELGISEQSERETPRTK